MTKLCGFFIAACMLTNVFGGDTWLFVAPQMVTRDSARFSILSDLICQELEIQGKISVKKIERPGDTVDFTSNPQALKDILAQNGARFGFSGKYYQIDNTFFLFIEKWDADGAILFRDRVSIKSDEDYDLLTKRVATCLLKNEQFAKTATTTTITKKDSQASRRKGGTMLLVGRMGFLYPYKNSFRTLDYDYSYSGSGSASPSYTKGTAFAMEGGFAFDIDFAILEATMGFDATRDLNFAIAGEYPFGQSDFCPYVGADLGVCLVNKAASGISNEDALEEDSDGMSLGLRAGVFLFRNHFFKLMPELRVFTVFNKDHDRGLRFTIGCMLL